MIAPNNLPPTLAAQAFLEHYEALDNEHSIAKGGPSGYCSCKDAMTFAREQCLFATHFEMLED